MDIITILAYLALFVILFITIVLGVQYYRGKLDTQPNIDISYPPSDYMISNGLLCPDWWKPSYSPTDPDNVICTNTKNISLPSSPPDTCGSLVDGKMTVTFPVIKNWPPTNAQDLQSTLASRCEWVHSCGQQGSSGASWMAIQNMCGV